MIKTDEPALTVLNPLLTICRDSQQGFERAADDVAVTELKKLFNEFAVQRMKFSEALHARIKTLRGEPAMRGSALGAFHRAWMDMKAEAEKARTHAVLAECERAEDIAVRAYRTALQTADVDEQTKRLIQEQYELVQVAHSRLRQLRDSPEYASR